MFFSDCNRFAGTLRLGKVDTANDLVVLNHNFFFRMTSKVQGFIFNMFKLYNLNVLSLIWSIIFNLNKFYWSVNLFTGKNTYSTYWEMFSSDKDSLSIDKCEIRIFLEDDRLLIDFFAVGLILWVTTFIFCSYTFTNSGLRYFWSWLWASFTNRGWWLIFLLDRCCNFLWGLGLLWNWYVKSLVYF